jgi:hypothetical protein
METVKIVFDIDTKDVKTSTEELKALNKITNEEVASLDKLSNAATDAGDGFVSLRTRVKEAKEEAVKAAEKYGEFSKEAQAAKIKAGALADQMGDLNRQVNLLNPEAKAKAFSNLAQGVVGAFSLATGALQAFGVKNKEVEALAMRLQGALNITQGIASLGALKESLADVKVVLGFTTAAQEGLTAAQKAQAIAAAEAAAGTAALTAAEEADAIAAAEAAAATKALNTSLLANPIFLVVAAIGALAAAYMTLNDEVKTAVLNEEELKKAKEKTVELKNKEAQAEIDLRVAKGETSKQAGEIEKIELKRVEDTKELQKKLADLNKEEEKNLEIIKNRKKLQQDLKNNYDKETAGLRAQSVEGVKNAEEANKKILQSKKVLQEQLNLINKTAKTDTNIQLADEANAKKDSDKKIADQSEETRKKQKAEAEKAAADLLRIQDQLRKQLQENSLMEITDPTQRIQQEKQFANEEYAIQLQRLQNAGATQAEIDLLAANHSALVAKYSQEEKDIEEKNQKERLASYKSFIDEMNGIASKAETDPIKKIQAENDAIDAKYAKQYALAKQNNEDTSALDNAYLAAVQTQQEKITNIIADEAKKQTDITKKEQADRLSQLRDYGNGAVDSLKFITDSVVQGDQAAREEELSQLEDQKNKKIISEEEYQKRLKAIKQKQAEDAKRAAIYNATLDLSRAIIAALTIPPPASVIAANFAAALAGLNLARIIATPIPKFQKGTLAVPGVDMGRDSVHAMLQPGEAVIPVSTNRAYHPTIRAIYERKIAASEINSFVMSRTSSGGKQSITANVDTFALGRALGKNKGVQIENAQVVGRVIAKELNTYNVRRGW